MEISEAYKHDWSEGRSAPDFIFNARHARRRLRAAIRRSVVRDIECRRILRKLEWCRRSDVPWMVYNLSTWKLTNTHIFMRDYGRYIDHLCEVRIPMEVAA